MRGKIRPRSLGRGLLGAACLLAGGLGVTGCASDPGAGAEPGTGTAPAVVETSPTADDGPGPSTLRPCTGQISIHCGSAPSVQFDPDGRLWAAFEQDGFVWVSASDDRGATFSEPRRVNAEAEAIETNGENRPKVVPAGASVPGGKALFVSWTKKLEGAFTGEIRFSRSTDGGRSFEAVRTINDDGLAIGHRFESLNVDERGDLYLAWIDKRDLTAAKARDEPYRGAALYYAVSRDGGATFAANRKVADHACECCRLALTDAPGGGSAVLWRHVFEPNLRDHAFTVLAPEGLGAPPRRVTWEGWELDGCPHHGPAMLPAKEGRYHFAWFTAADDEPAIYYGRFDPRSGSLEDRVALARAGASHPSLAGNAERVVVAWKQTEEDGATVVAVRSTDGGATWGVPSPVAHTEGASDHPLLVRHGGEVFLSWHAEAEGWRLLLISAGSHRSA